MRPETAFAKKQVWTSFASMPASASASFTASSASVRTVRSRCLPNFVMPIPATTTFSDIWDSFVTPR
jgi:hypothetical protein